MVIGTLQALNEYLLNTGWSRELRTTSKVKAQRISLSQARTKEARVRGVFMRPKLLLAAEITEGFSKAETLALVVWSTRDFNQQRWKELQQNYLMQKHRLLRGKWAAVTGRWAG